MFHIALTPSYYPTNALSARGKTLLAAIADAASSILLIHNHPSGDPTPSRQDHEVTARLKQVGEIIGITIIDHIVVGDGKALSLAEHS